MKNIIKALTITFFLYLSSFPAHSSMTNDIIDDIIDKHNTTGLPNVYEVDLYKLTELEYDFYHNYFLESEHITTDEFNVFTQKTKALRLSIRNGTFKQEPKETISNFFWFCFWGYILFAALISWLFVHFLFSDGIEIVYIKEEEEEEEEESIK